MYRWRCAMACTSLLRLFDWWTYRIGSARLRLRDRYYNLLILQLIRFGAMAAI
jgi:hypothetical protein